MTRTALVTGGAGFIGRHVVDALAATQQVRVLDDFYRFDNPDAFRDHDAVSVIEGDVRDRETVEDALDGVTDVVHLAAVSRVTPCREDPERAFTTNVGGTVTVLEAALETGVERFLFASSRETYGDAPEPVTEDAPLAPNNRYAASKAAAERYVQFFGDTTALETCTLRIANTYGPGDRDRAIPIFLERARNDDPITLYGGDQVLDFVWIGDVVETITRSLDGHAHPVLNVGAGESVPIKEVARTIIDLTGSTSEIVYEEPRPYETETIQMDVSRLRSLSIEPRSLEDGLERLIERTEGS